MLLLQNRLLDQHLSSLLIVIDSAHSHLFELLLRGLEYLFCRSEGYNFIYYNVIEFRTISKRRVYVLTRLSVSLFHWTLIEIIMIIIVFGNLSFPVATLKCLGR